MKPVRKIRIFRWVNELQEEWTENIWFWQNSFVIQRKAMDKIDMQTRASIVSIYQNWTIEQLHNVEL